MKLNAITLVLLCLALVAADRAHAAPAPRDGVLAKRLTRGCLGGKCLFGGKGKAKSTSSSPSSSPEPVWKMKTPINADNPPTIPRPASSVPYGYEPWKTGRPAGMKQPGQKTQPATTDMRMRLPDNYKFPSKGEIAPASPSYPRPSERSLDDDDVSSGEVSDPDVPAPAEGLQTRDLDKRLKGCLGGKCFGGKAQTSSPPPQSAHGGSPGHVQMTPQTPGRVPQTPQHPRPDTPVPGVYKSWEDARGTGPVRGGGTNSQLPPTDVRTRLPPDYKHGSDKGTASSSQPRPLVRSIGDLAEGLTENIHARAGKFTLGCPGCFKGNSGVDRVPSSQRPQPQPAPQLNQNYKPWETGRPDGLKQPSGLTPPPARLGEGSSRGTSGGSALPPPPGAKMADTTIKGDYKPWENGRAPSLKQPSNNPSVPDSPINVHGSANQSPPDSPIYVHGMSP